METRCFVQCPLPATQPHTMPRGSAKPVAAAADAAAPVEGVVAKAVTKAGKKTGKTVATKGSKKTGKTAVKKSGGEKKQHRWRSGTVALREIKKLQKGSKLLIQKAPFQRLVRASMEAAGKSGLSFKPSALEAVQEAAENYLVGLFEGAVILQLHRGKKTLNHKDLSYTRRIRGDLSA